MDTEQQRTARWTGWSGTAAFLGTTAVIPLWFVHDGPPPLGNVELRAFVDLFVLVLVAGFWVGFCVLGRRALVPATCALLGATVFVAVTLTAEATQVGNALRSGGTTDPTLVGSGAEGAVVVLGPVARLLTALTLAAAALVVRRSGILPRWIAVLAAVVALVHLALVPTLFAGTDPARPLSLNGWGIPVASGLYLLWILLAGQLLLGRARRARADARDLDDPAVARATSR